MPDVRPFRGWRYELGRVGALSDVVAPPYDVIDAELQARLYERSPYNVVRLEWNREEPGDDERNNRYVRAARLLKEWQRDEILRQDDDETFYACHQTFTVEGQDADHTAIVFGDIDNVLGVNIEHGGTYELCWPDGQQLSRL